MILVDIMCNNAKYNILKVVGWISTFMCGLRCERQCEPWYVKVENTAGHIVWFTLWEQCEPWYVKLPGPVCESARAG